LYPKRVRKRPSPDLARAPSEMAVPERANPAFDPSFATGMAMD
jgi:hypothetical protein